jgi:RNA-directed DNA polymerase
VLLERLSTQLGMRTERLEHFAATASKRYYVFPIDKRNGGKRWIAHPSRPLKLLQRWLNSRVIRILRVHDAATAYRRGVSIRDNATAHAPSAFTLRVDFKDFFPSFKADSVRRFIQDNSELFEGWSDKDTSFFVQIVCRAGELTIGAPSSPFLTNSMMLSFDEKVAQYCVENGLIYTRYADDLFVSAHEPGKLQDALAIIRDAARNFPYANLQINEEKTAFLSRRYRRRITGLIVTPDGRVSLGRDRKRELKALVHEYRTGHLPNEKLDYLKGLLAFAFDSDPRFFVSLTKKYGRNILSDLIGKGQVMTMDIVLGPTLESGP